jgi:hypothetical protein
MMERNRRNVASGCNSLCLFPDVPVVSLKMGSSLNPDDIKEGDDVYFECNIRANPKAYRLAWFHDVSKSKCIYDYCYGNCYSELTKRANHIHGYPKNMCSYFLRNSNGT